MLFVVLVKVSLNFTKAGVTCEEGMPPSQQPVGMLEGRAQPTVGSATLCQYTAFLLGPCSSSSLHLPASVSLIKNYRL